MEALAGSLRRHVCSNRLQSGGAPAVATQRRLRARLFHLFQLTFPECGRPRTAAHIENRPFICDNLPLVIGAADRIIKSVRDEFNKLVEPINRTGANAGRLHPSKQKLRAALLSAGKKPCEMHHTSLKIKRVSAQILQTM